MGFRSIKQVLSSFAGTINSSLKKKGFEYFYFINRVDLVQLLKVNVYLFHIKWHFIISDCCEVLSVMLCFTNRVTLCWWNHPFKGALSIVGWVVSFVWRCRVWNHKRFLWFMNALSVLFVSALKEYWYLLTINKCIKWLSSILLPPSSISLFFLYLEWLLV